MAAEFEYLDTVTHLMFDEQAWWIIGSRDKTEKMQQKLFVVLSRGEPLAINCRSLYCGRPPIRRYTV